MSRAGDIAGIERWLAYGDVDAVVDTRTYPSFGKYAHRAEHNGETLLILVSGHCAGDAHLAIARELLKRGADVNHDPTGKR